MGSRFPDRFNNSWVGDTQARDIKLERLRVVGISDSEEEYIGATALSWQSPGFPACDGPRHSHPCCRGD